MEDNITDFNTFPEMEYFDDEGFRESLMDQCGGKRECIANMT